MNTNNHSSSLLGLLVAFGCVFMGVVIFTSYETINASQNSIQSNGTSSSPYPPPQIVTQEPIYSEGPYPPPYPPPGSQPPIPTSTAVIQIPAPIPILRA